MLIRETKRRYLLYSLILALLLPMGISLHHALMQHEVNICHAEGEHHVHEFHVNCDHDHYFNTSQGLEPRSADSCIGDLPDSLQKVLHPRLDEDPYLILSKGRAPPAITVYC